MAEELNPQKEGERIVQQYLSKRGWAGEWRRTLSRQLYPAVNREEFEAKQRQCDKMEDEAEEYLSSTVEYWRHQTSKEAEAVLQQIYSRLARRTDLGFFAQKIVEHLKKNYFTL